jgi:ribosomal protein L32
VGSINQKLGLKAKSRTRQATHGRGIVSAAQCPKCGGRHVVEHAIHNIPTRLCGFCGHVWIEPNRR